MRCERHPKVRFNKVFFFFSKRDVNYSALSWTWHRGGAAPSGTISSRWPSLRHLSYNIFRINGGRSAPIGVKTRILLLKWVWRSRLCSPGSSGRGRWGYWWVSITARLTSSVDKRLKIVHTDEMQLVTVVNPSLTNRCAVLSLRAFSIEASKTSRHWLMSLNNGIWKRRIVASLAHFLCTQRFILL